MFFNSVIQAADSTCTGMQRPERRPQPCPGHPQAQKDAPEQDGAPRVRGDVQHMVRQRIQPPERVSEPEGGEDERVVNCPAGRPDFLEAERPDDALVRRQVRVIIPDETRVPDRQVGDENRRRQQQRRPQFSRQRGRGAEPGRRVCHHASARILGNFHACASRQRRQA